MSNLIFLINKYVNGMITLQQPVIADVWLPAMKLPRPVHHMIEHVYP